MHAATSSRPATSAPPNTGSAPQSAPPKHATTTARAASRGAPTLDQWVLAALLALPIGLTIWGLRYYLLPIGARMRHPLHPLLKPSGTIGLWLGVAGLALFLFMWLYPMRKKVRWLAWTGTLGNWMRVHVLAGLWVPLVVAVHAGWRFEGLIGLGYFAMLLVSMSGIVGRYLYTRIPRSRNGLELSLDEVAMERRALVTGIGLSLGLDPAAVERALATDQRPYAGLDPVRTLWRLAQDDWARARALRELKREWSRPRPGAPALDKKALNATLRLARRELALSQQMRMLDATRRIFGFWHVAHRPVAITALIAVVVHVVVAFMVGGVQLAGPK